MDLWLARHVVNHGLSALGFGAILATKTVLALVALALVAAGMEAGLIGRVLVGYGLEAALLGAVLFIDNIGFTCGSVLEGNRRLGKLAVMVLCRWGTLGAVGLTLLWRGDGLVAAALAYVAAATVRAGLGLVLVRPHLVPQGPRLSSGALLAGAAPMALLNFVGVALFYVDMLMLPELRGATETGLYKAAYSLVEALGFLAAGMAAALYPLFSQAEVPLSVKVDQLVRGGRLLLFLAFPIAYGTGLVAEDVLRLVYWQRADEFAVAGTALSWLVWSLPATFLIACMMRFFLGLERQALVLRLFLVALLVNIAANAVLIPSWGHMGAVGATLVSSAGLLLAFLFYLHRRIAPLDLKRLLAAPLLSGLVVLPAGWLAGQAHPALVVPVAALAYAGVLLGGRLVRRDELARLGKNPEGEDRAEQ